MRRVVVFLWLPVVCCLAACPNDYTEYVPGKCAKYNKNQMSYGQARTRCQSEGGDLISIHSQAENDAIYNQEHTGDDAWIGLHCDQQTRAFTWTDGTPLDYTALSDKTCRTPTGGYVMSRFTGLWSSGTERTYHSICGIDMRSCSAGYAYAEEASLCVKVFEIADSWQNAEAACQKDAAHLVSIHDQKTNDFVRQTAASHGLLSGVFIGIEQRTNGTTFWSDGSQVNFQNFDLGMPNDIFGQCGAMLTGVIEGPWVSAHCDAITQLPYVCAKSRNT